MIDLLKTSYDSADLTLLKDFVKRNLSSKDRTSLAFESGRLTHKGHLAAIIKMALVLKKLTLESNSGSKSAPSAAPKSSLNDSDDNEEDQEEENSVKHSHENHHHHSGASGDAEWARFCTAGPLMAFETKWTKKLEEYRPEDRHQP